MRTSDPDLAAPLSPPLRAGVVRLSVAALLLIAEYELLAVAFDGAALSGSNSPWAVFGNAGLAVCLAVTVATSGALLTRGRFVAELATFSASQRYDSRWGAAHVAAYAAFWFCTSKIFVEGGGQSTVTAGWLGAWFICGVLTVGSLLGFVAGHAAGGIARILSRVAAAGLALGTLAWLVAARAPALWPRLSGATLRTAAILLRLLGRSVVSDEAHQIVGADGFSVQVAAPCSGVEGMTLISFFVLAYLVRFRKGLRFPRALLLLPISVVVAFAANAVRIALLVLVGAHLSPDVAFGGFHSKAGWFLFCGIALGIVAVVERTGVFARRADSSPPATHDLTAAYLLPELTLLVVALSTGLFTAGVDFLYPLRIVFAIGALIAVGKPLRGLLVRPSWTSVLVGSAVFGLWLLLAHGATPAFATELRDGLQRLDASRRLAFLFFRVTGSVLVVPTAEELAFRGYLQRRLVAEDFARVSLRRPTTVSWIVTALAFGALHQSFMAALVASLAYSAAAHRRGQLADAIAAHATTNALIAIWVVALDRWDLWTRTVSHHRAALPTTAHTSSQISSLHDMNDEDRPGLYVCCVRRVSSSRMRTGRATPAAGLPAVRHGVPAPGASGFSGTHARVRRPEESEAVVAFAPDADERVRALEQKLANVESELREVRLERDDLDRRLRAALDELAGARATVRPPSAESTETSATHRIDPLGATFLQAPEAPLVRSFEAPLAHRVEVPIAAAAEASAVHPMVSVPSLAPSIHATPSQSAELSRLVVSTRPAAPSESMAPPSSGAERRLKERRECEFDVEFLGDSHFITGITQDLSEGGVFVATYQRLPIGTPVSLAFELPDGHRVEARGEVRWIRGEREESGTRPGLGIAFTELDGESLSKITAFCGSLPARYYEF